MACAHWAKSPSWYECHSSAWMNGLTWMSVIGKSWKNIYFKILRLFFWKNKLFVVEPDCRVQYYVRIHYEIFSYNYVPLKYSKVFFGDRVFFHIPPQGTIFLFDLTQVNLASSTICMNRNQILRSSIKDPKLGTKLVMKSKS